MKKKRMRKEIKYLEWEVDFHVDTVVQLKEQLADSKKRGILHLNTCEALQVLNDNLLLENKQLAELERKYNQDRANFSEQVKRYRTANKALSEKLRQEGIVLAKDPHDINDSYRVV